MLARRTRRAAGRRRRRARRAARRGGQGVRRARRRRRRRARAPGAPSGSASFKVPRSWEFRDDLPLTRRRTGWRRPSCEAARMAERDRPTCCSPTPGCVTLDGDAVAPAVAIWRDRIVALEEVPARRTIDLGGAVVTPGFHDAHNHMAWYGLSLDEVDCGCRRLDALYDAVAARAATAARRRLGRRRRLRREQARRPPDPRRAWTVRRPAAGCGSSTPPATCAWSTAGARRPRHRGRPGRRARRPGRHRRRRAPDRAAPGAGPAAAQPAGPPLPRRHAGRRDRARRAGLPVEGITSVTEAGIGGGWIGKSPVEVAAYQRARDQGRLPVRVELMVAADVLHPVAAHEDDDSASGSTSASAPGSATTGCASGR